MHWPCLMFLNIAESDTKSCLETVNSMAINRRFYYSGLNRSTFSYLTTTRGLRLGHGANTEAQRCPVDSRLLPSFYGPCWRLLLLCLLFPAADGHYTSRPHSFMLTVQKGSNKTKKNNNKIINK